MDKDNKELLEATCRGLEDKIGALNLELKNKQKELEDYNKPLLLNETYAALEDVIGNTIGDYEFDCGEFDYEFNINYDNKIELDNLSFNDHYNLAEAVMKAIDNHFKLEENEETNK